MKFETIVAISIILVISCITISFAETDPNDSINTENVDVDDAQLDYRKGSACGYCKYCEFCSLCEKDCPCAQSVTKPNCHMCKYCKFCYLCSAVCDTICQPGGILDKVSAAIVGALPFNDKDEIDKDLKSIKGWMDANKKEEL